MSPDKKPDKKKPDENQKNENAPTGADKGERSLLNPEEWEEPAGRKVIGEYHKEGLSESAAGGESDLDSFEQYWKVRGRSKMRSEYHKEGAPYMEASPEPDGRRFDPGETSDKITEKENPGGRETSQDIGAKGDEKDKGNAEGKETLDTGKASDSQTRQPPIERTLDLTTVEVLTFAMFRVLFGRGIRVPLKREGVIDMDIVVKDRDILLNTNEILFEVPELSIWRFIIAYKGKPVLEYGRGIKRRIKIYYYRMFCLLLAMWWVSWKKRRAQSKVRKSEIRVGETKSKDAETDDR